MRERNKSLLIRDKNQLEYELNGDEAAGGSPQSKNKIDSPEKSGVKLESPTKVDADVGGDISPELQQ